MQKGQQHTEEAINKMKIAKSGENHPMFGRTGEDNPNWGRKLSEETKDKIAKTNSIRLRGIKLINTDTKEVVKTPYDQILHMIQNEHWDFKSKHVMINNNTDKQRIIPVYRVDEFFPDKGWFFGSLEKK